MDIQHVAHLANLPLTSQEEKTYAPQLDSTLQYVDQLQKIDTSTVWDKVTASGEVNVMRPDVVEECKPLISGFVKTQAIFKDND